MPRGSAFPDIGLQTTSTSLSSASAHVIENRSSISCREAGAVHATAPARQRGQQRTETGADLSAQEPAQHRLDAHLGNHPADPDPLTAGMQVHLILRAVRTRLDGHGEDRVRAEDRRAVAVPGHASDLPRVGPEPSLLSERTAARTILRPGALGSAGPLVSALAP